jgi:excisionase family DNA binding protein
MAHEDMNDVDVLTPGEVAKLFRVDPKTVTRWAADGKLPGAFRTPGGHRRFHRKDIVAFLEGSGMTIREEGNQ